jgi:hypothetical protein
MSLLTSLLRHVTMDGAAIPLNATRSSRSSTCRSSGSGSNSEFNIAPRISITRSPPSSADVNGLLFEEFSQPHLFYGLEHSSLQWENDKVVVFAPINDEKTCIIDADVKLDQKELIQGKSVLSAFV